MKMLLKKGDVAKQLNDLKQSIKMSIASINYNFKDFFLNKIFIISDDLDIPSGSVIHEKIVSEDDREILMISRKNSEKFSTFKTMLEREFGQKKSDQPSTSSQSILNLEIDTDAILKSVQGKDKDEIILTISQEKENLEMFKEGVNREYIQETEVIIVDIEKESSDVPMSQTTVETIVTNEIKEKIVLKRSHEEDININIDVSEPKLTKLNDNINNVVQIDESDTDEDGIGIRYLMIYQIKKLFLFRFRKSYYT
jgi:hypothetical protein